jgi:hypothetical protein
MKKYLLTPIILLIAIYAQAQTGHWELIKTKNKTDGRSECGLAGVGGKLYLIGGDGLPANVEVFDPATLTWSKKAMVPVTFK